MIRLYLIFFLILISIAGCKKGDKVPAYLEIPEMVVVSANGNDTITSRITDAWIYANDELLGVWEIPARVPVLAEGNTRLQISPAVKRNGMYDDRFRYPFFQLWNGEAELVKEGTSIVRPQIRYINNVDLWTEAFEDAGMQLSVTAESDTGLLRYTPANDPDHLLNGTAAGGFVLDQQHPYIRAYTEQDFNVTGGPVCLELDYSTNVVLTVGVLFSQNNSEQAQPFVYLVPTTEATNLPTWNKIYIDLSPIFNLAISQRDLYFEAWAPEGGTAKVYLDNIKLVRTS